MNTKRKQLLIALVFGAFALMGNHYYLSSRIDELSPKKMMKIVRAKKSIPAGTPLSASLIEAMEIPGSFAPKSAILWSESSTVLGSEVAVDITAGDYVLETYLSSRGNIGYKLSEQVEKNGNRAITIPVDEVNSLSRSILTGDRIDILYTFAVPGTSQRMSVLFLQNVPVIATGSYSAAEQELGSKGASNKRYGTVTLKLPARDAARLNFARQSGQISILLRNGEDSAAVDLPALTGVRDLLSASDRELMEGMIKNQGMNSETNERIRDQLKEMLEMQRSQARK